MYEYADVGGHRGGAGVDRRGEAGSSSGVRQMIRSFGEHGFGEDSGGVCVNWCREATNQMMRAVVVSALRQSRTSARGQARETECSLV